MKYVYDNTPAELVISLLMLIIAILFAGWMLYLLFSSGFKTSNPTDPVSTDKRVVTSFVCAPGQCATDFASGVKTCPANPNASIVIDPSQSVCNSRFLCDNPLTPYALQSDGSTNINGVCENEVECSCLRINQCADYIVSVFNSSNGNPYESLLGQRITFPQSSTYVNINGSQASTTPIQYANPATTFCALPFNWLPYANPGCNFVSDPTTFSYNDLVVCMGQANGCSGLQGNPCLQGTLAIISSNPDNLTQLNLPATQLACVTGEPCPCGQVAIYDTNYGGVVCRPLPKT